MRVLSLNAKISSFFTHQITKSPKRPLKGMASVQHENDGYESPGARVRARARIQLEKLSHPSSTLSAMMATATPSESEQPRAVGVGIFKNSNPSCSEEKEEETEVNERRRLQSTADTCSTSSVQLMRSSMLELETTIQVLREKLTMAKSTETKSTRMLAEEQRKCEELKQSNDDLRCMHREVSKELANLKRFVSSQGISSMKSAAAIAEADEEDEDSRSYLASLLAEAKSEALEKQLKIDSLKRKHLSMEGRSRGC